MGLRSKPRVFLNQDEAARRLPDVHGALNSQERPDPINDVGTDEEQVILRLGNLATTGDFGYDDSRQWGELLPTIPTLIGALHLLPEVLEGKTPGERQRLAELFDAKFEEQFGEHDRNLFARAIKPNQGMSAAHGLLLDARRLGAQADALHIQNEGLVKERGIAYRATDEWNERFREAEKLNEEKREQLLKLHHNPDFSPTAKKMLSAWRDFDGASSRLRRDVLAYIDGDASASYDRTRSFAEDWLASFERLKAAVKAPNPKRQDGAPAEEPAAEVYDDDL